MPPSKQSKMLILGIVFSPILLWLGLWLLILLSSQAYTYSLSKTGLWPLICSSQGCVTTSSWHKQYQAQKVFAAETGVNTPTPTATLTTLARQYLVDKAINHWPISIQDASRYRQVVLHLQDEEKIQRATGLTLTDYDQYVILPLLKQELIKEQMGLESYDQLFYQLAQQHSLWVLPRGLWWDKKTATVIKR